MNSEKETQSNANEGKAARTKLLQELLELGLQDHQQFRAVTLIKGLIGLRRETPLVAGSDRRGSIATVDEIFGEALRERARFADGKLRQHLAGTILFRIWTNTRGDQEKKYLVDWSADTFQCGPTDRDTADCVIRVGDQVLVKIVNGDLNPQVVMVSDKMKIEGKASLAVYFFNLTA